MRENLRIAILANAVQKETILEKGIPENIEVLWPDSLRSLELVEDAHACFDLQYTFDAFRNEALSRWLPRPVFVHAVEIDSARIGFPFIRVNAWPGMIKRSILEIAYPAPAFQFQPGVEKHSNAPKKEEVEDCLNTLGWTFQWAPDLPGMITPRILVSLINEAYFTFGDGVSSKEEIDIAMRFGTNYPKGPFAWAQEIGIESVFLLLKEMKQGSSRYAIAPALQKEFEALPSTSNSA